MISNRPALAGNCEKVHLEYILTGQTLWRVCEINIFTYLCECFGLERTNQFPKGFQLIVVTGFSGLRSTTICSLPVLRLVSSSSLAISACCPRLSTRLFGD